MVLVGCIIFITPVLIMVLTAMQPNSDILARGPAAVPENITFGNFPAAWSQGALAHYYVNSALIVLVKVPLGITVASLAAYPLSKHRFQGSRAVLVCLLVGLGVPQVITLYPLLQLSHDIRLQGSVWVLLLPYLAFGLPFEILVMRGAFKRVPNELLDAARVDGASEWRIWARVCIPASLAAIAALAILDGVATWNEFLVALTLVSNQQSYTLPLGILNLQGLFSTNFSQLQAGVLIGVLPTILLLVIARRYLTRGVEVGGVKG